MKRDEMKCRDADLNKLTDWLIFYQIFYHLNLILAYHIEKKIAGIKDKKSKIVFCV